MESGTYFDQLRSNGTSLAAAARKAPDAAIAACPGWDMTTLVGHVGGVYRWAAEMVRTGALERISRRDMDPPPSDQAILVGWYEDALAEVTGVLEAADPDAAVRGPASTLLLWLWNRVPTDAAGLQPFGDQEVMGQIAALGF
jgi:hypothetical protein